MSDVAELVANYVAEEARAATPSVSPSEFEELRRLRREVEELRVEKEILRKGSGLFHPGDDPVCRFRFVADHRHAYGVKRLCRVLGVSRSGSYTAALARVNQFRIWTSDGAFPLEASTMAGRSLHLDLQMARQVARPTGVIGFAALWCTWQGTRLAERHPDYLDQMMLPAPLGEHGLFYSCKPRLS